MTGFFFYRAAQSASRALCFWVWVASVAGCSSTTIVVSGDPGQDAGTPATDDDSGATSGSGGSSGSSGSSSGSSGSPGSSSGIDPSKALTPGTSTITLTAAGKSRSIILVVPSAVTTQRLPLVIALHGDGDTNSNFIQTSTLQALAASESFVLAAPQGITQNLVVQGQTLPPLDWDPYRDASDGNIDLPMLKALQAQLVATTSIDTKHIVVFGYSQGGYMSFRYGMDASASLACSAVMAAANPLGPTLTAAAPRKIPVSLQVGTNDSAVTQARTTKTDLTAKGFPLDYHEIAGAGHVPIPGGVTGPLTYCLGQTLP